MSRVSDAVSQITESGAMSRITDGQYSPELTSSTRLKASGSFCLKNRFRHFLIVIALACLSIVNSNITAFNQVIMCIKNETDSSEPHYPITISEEAWLQQAIGVGSLLGTFPYNYGFSKIGAKYLFGVCGFISGICGALTPLAAKSGFWWFFTMRFIQGFIFSADFSMVGLLITKWSPLNRSAFTVSLLTLFTPISSVITFALSGPACESSMGWPILYYGLAVATFVCFTLWFVFYNDEPANNRFLSQEEYDLISEGKNKEEMAKKQTNIPYMKIFKSPTIWTVWYNAFADMFSSFFFYAYIGRFHVHVLKFDTITAGYLAALPPAPFIITKLFFGYANDRMTCCSERIKINIFNTVDVMGMGIFLFATGAIPPEYWYLTITALCLTYVSMSFAGGAFYKCAHLAARQYSSFVIAMIQFLKSVSLLTVPSLFALVIRTDEDLDKMERWRPAFFTLAGLMFSAGFLFYFFSTADPLPFTKTGESSSEDETATKSKEESQV
ncbi:unnamed protein product [Bursaphelenchus okinawaensis]|uniref:MFS domain-containing protein n=1 Tax=Bursaphelenchus okinawaensis TaxID=465554 RepID=A0A811KYG5_9BILA|nr:unnamed protein product [Bursaphelenchus okinawaensis]CAG9114243.1 unnamed protein product [Bursaphelenchus okinawaensis]